MLKEIGFLIKKEFQIEWRQKYAIGGILLYVLSTVFVVYYSFIQIEASIWNALFWVIALFASVNAITKSFSQESGRRQLYYYSLSHPSSILVSKIAYNFILLLGINLFTWLMLSILAGAAVLNQAVFFLALFLGSLGFSIAFTFTSAIASKASNSSSLMAIMSFPVVLPILMTIIRLSGNALRPIQDTALYKDVLTLLSIDLILISLVFILFPYLWRD